ncbi:MAG: hypothetical protein PHD70_14485 [Anaerostipes sp.]|nr:hypothetical protein [Anaerostipes sp.]
MKCILDNTSYCNHEQCKQVLEYAMEETCISNCCYTCSKEACGCTCNNAAHKEE